MSNNTKIRIYQLGKELDLSSKEVLSAAKKLNIFANTHASSIGHTEATKIRELLIKRKKEITSKTRFKQSSKSSISNTINLEQKSQLPQIKSNNTDRDQKNYQSRSLIQKEDKAISNSFRKNRLLTYLDKIDIKDISLNFKTKLQKIRNINYKKLRSPLTNLTLSLITIVNERINKLKLKQEDLRNKIKLQISNHSKNSVQDQGPKKEEFYKIFLAKSGPLIKARRKELKITTKQLALSLNINEKKLIAIENCKENELPERVFVKGIIRRIFERLSLDLTILEKEVDKLAIKKNQIKGGEDEQKRKAIVEKESSPKNDNNKDSSKEIKKKTLDKFSKLISLYKKVKDRIKAKDHNIIKTTNESIKEKLFKYSIRFKENLQNKIHLSNKLNPALQSQKQLENEFNIKPLNQKKMNIKAHLNDTSTTIVPQIRKLFDFKLKYDLSSLLKNKKNKKATILLGLSNIRLFLKPIFQSKFYNSRLMKDRKANLLKLVKKISDTRNNIIQNLSKNSPLDMPTDKIIENNSNEKINQVKQFSKEFFSLFKNDIFKLLDKTTRTISSSEYYQKSELFLNSKIKVLNEKYLDDKNFKIPNINAADIKFDVKVDQQEYMQNMTITLKSQDYMIISYSDHKLIFSHITETGSKISIQNLINMDVPADLIGDYKVENSEEVVNIIKDIIQVFDVNGAPIILLLGSSFFTARTFSDNELAVFSETDPTLLSKSPFIPLNTSIQYSRVTGDKQTSYHRVIYIEKGILESWVSVLSLLETPIIGLTCSALSIIEYISSTNSDELTLLCDIDRNFVSLFLQKTDCELISEKLPYGSSLYLSENQAVSNQFFDRLNNSIKSFLDKHNYQLDNKPYLTGSGLDILVDKSQFPNDEFNRFNLITEYDFTIKESLKLKHHENVSNFSSFVLQVKQLLK